jgi:hypothetical protein
VAGAAAILAGCGVSGTGAPQAGAPKRPSRAVAPALAARPATVAGRALAVAGRGTLRRGTRLPSADLGVRLFSDDKHGFALATTAKRGDRTYPATSGDGGRTWKVDGPVLHMPSSKGSAAVSEPGMTTPHLLYAWTPGNAALDVSADGGGHWWQTTLPDIVLSVEADRGPPGFTNGLDAIVEGPAGNADGEGALLWEYRTTDGRHWRFVADLSALA